MTTRRTITFGFMACLLFTGCNNDPALNVVDDVLSGWNEYADICLQMHDEKSAAYFFDNKLKALDDRWGHTKTPRTDILRALGKKDKEKFFETINNEPWSKRGQATMERLVFAVNRLNDVIAKEEARVREERRAAGDNTQVNRADVCKKLIETQKMRDRLYFDFAVAIPQDAKMSWSFPKAKG